MPYFEVNLHFFLNNQLMSDVLLFVLYLSHSSLNSHVMKVEKVN